MKYFISLIFVLTFFCFQGQQYSFLSYTQEQGLGHSQIKSIYQDSHGYMWIGTLAGISKFDGREFFNHTKIEGLSGTAVYEISELKDHRLVIGGKGGISFYHNEVFEGRKFEGEFSRAIVHDIIEMKNGELWIITNIGFIIFKDDSFSYKIIDDLTNSLTMILLSDTEVLFNGDSSLIKYNGISLDTIYHGNSEITDFQKINKTSFWLSTRNGAQNKNGMQKITRKKNNEGFEIEKTYNKEQKFSSIHLDSKGVLWGLAPQSCYVIKDDSLLILGKHNGLDTQRIFVIFEDSEGNIWFGTDGGGLLKLTTTNIATFTKKDGLSSDLVMSFTEEKNHSMWVATYDGGVNKIVNNKATPYSVGDATGKRIWKNLVDSDGRIWFGMNRGLLRKDNDNIEVIDSEKLESRRIQTLYEDHDKRLWVGSRSGVNYIYKDSIYSLHLPKEINLNKTRSIKQDATGNMWFGGLFGVFEYDGKNYNRYSEEDGLSDNSVYDIEFDYVNNVWIGTTSGLCLLKQSEGKITNIPVDNNPLSDRINFLHKKDSFLLVGTNNGMYGLNLDQFYSTNIADFFHIGIEDGLPSLELNQNAVFTDSHGNVWVGTTKGASRITSIEDIYNKNITSAKPKIVLNNIKLNLQDVNWQSLNTEVDLYFGLPKDLVVDYKKNHFTFQYNGLSFSNPKNINYRYILQGFDKEWQPLTYENFATYSNLDAGQYVFMVKCENENGIWSEPLSYSFEIKPPYWFTWWFIVLGILALSFLVFFIYHRRKKVIDSKHQSQLLALEQQSLNSSMNRHFIFNSLNSIQYYINSEDRKAANKYLTSFAQLIRKNLDVSQANHTSLSEEVERLKLYLQLENMRFKDRFDYEITIDSEIDQDEVKIPAMLLQPFLENSIWHGLLRLERKGLLEVIIKKVGEQIEIFIRDNGIGIDTSLKEKSERGEKTHDSKGMKITKNRLDLLRKMTNSTMEIIGPYEIKSNNNETKGTEVRIILTINYEKKYG